MKIKELNISEFGCLKNKRIAFGEKMNIIYGENESGKSTVLLFIKFMLYGLGRRSANNTERERSVSWSGHIAAGSMTFSHGGKEYRIERRFLDAARGGSDSVSIIRLDNGETVETEKSPGEFFLGVPKEVFESSACVGQMCATSINGDKTSSSIQNILSSADESVDTAKILKSLETLKTSYLHKNKNGGSLYLSERELSALRQRLDKARDDSVSLEEKTQWLAAAESEREVVKADLEAKDRLLSELNKITVLQRFAKLHSLADEYDGLLAQKTKYTSDNLNTEFMPDRDHVAELKFAIRELEASKTRLEEKRLKKNESENEEYNPEQAALGETLEADGGAVAVLERVKEKKKKISAYGTAITGSVIGIVLSAIGTVAIMLGGVTWGAAAILIPVLLIPSVIASAKGKSKRKAELKELLSKYAADEQNMEQMLDEYAKALAAMRRVSAERAQSDAEYGEALAAFERVREKLEALLIKTLPKAEPEQETARAEQQRLEGFIARCESLDGEAQALKRIIESERNALSSYDEQALKSEVSTDINSVTPEIIADAERQRRFLQGKVDSFERRIVALKEDIARLKASNEDPLPIADALSERTAEHEKNTEFYEALSLAAETIESAGEVMSGNIMPSVAKEASEIMARISDEKYTVLRSTSAFALSLDSEGFGVKADFLSAGTKDAAYLSLRIALFMRIFGSELPPLILDEALCQIDDIRAERSLAMLGEICEGGIQCLLFSSHKRENEICAKIGIKTDNLVLDGQVAQ